MATFNAVCAWCRRRRTAQFRNVASLGIAALGWFLVGIMLAAGEVAAIAQSAAFTVEGTVLNTAHQPVADAAVRLIEKDAAVARETRSDAHGAFVFSGVGRGVYRVNAGAADTDNTTVEIADASRRGIVLTMKSDGGIGHGSAEAMDFADSPNFTVAGVTDWTAAGGHGSDVSLRTSEELTRETIALRPEALQTSKVEEGNEAQLRAAVALEPKGYAANHALGEFYLHEGKYAEALPWLKAADGAEPADRDNEYDLALTLLKSGDAAGARVELVAKLGMMTRDTKHTEMGKAAALHRLAGDVYEKLNDPLMAVQEYKRAVELEPSEENYFAWGTELMLHRAVLQAADVFRNALKAHPGSARLLAALGTAEFATADYDAAAASLCAASDLDPADAEPYLFMGRVEVAAPAPLPCIEEKLARFAHMKPERADADYLYAMALIKRQEQAGSQEQMVRIEGLLKKAVAVDPKCDEAYLQLGILDFSRRDYPRAIDAYRKALEVEPKLGEAHYRLGVAYDRTGEHDKAVQEYARHDEIEKENAAEVEKQRRSVKQFLVVLQGQATQPVAN